MTLVAIVGEDADVTRSFNRTRLLTSLGLALGVVIIVFSATKARTGADQQNLPEGVEAVRPERDAQVQRQTEIIVDLSPGYDGVLRLNGLEIPADQVSFDQGLNELIFPCRPNLDIGTTDSGDANATSARPPQPRCVRNDPNAELVSVPKGPVVAAVEYWKISAGRAAGSRVFTWNFQAT
jgi:hypothetical protein